jgi:hypothetical protein
MLVALLFAALSSMFVQKRMQERLLGADSTGYRLWMDQWKDISSVAAVLC